MKDMKILGAFGLVIALLWGMFYFGIGPAAGFTCDQGSINAMKREDPARAAAYQVAYDQRCKPGTTIDQSDNRDVDNDDTGTGTTTTQVNPPAQPANDPFVKVNERYSWLHPYTVEQMVTWDANEKVSHASGGPYFAIHPDLWGKDLKDLSAEEMVKEAKFRLAFSPASLASNGAMFGYWSYDPEVLDAKVASYLSDVDRWKADAKMISDRWDLELQNGIKKYEETKGNFTATFFYVSDGRPYVRINKNVDRTSDFWVFELSDGTLVRAACGLNQEYWRNNVPSPTKEKVKHVEPIKLPPVAHNQEATPVEVVQAVTPPPPAATPTDTSKPEPTDNSKPEPTDTSKPEPTPTPEPKKPEDDVNVNPSIPPQERVDPIQSAPPEQAQPTKPPEAPSTPRVNPPAPDRDPVPRDDPTPPPPPEDDGGDNGGAPAAP